LGSDGADQDPKEIKAPAVKKAAKKVAAPVSDVVAPEDPKTKKVVKRADPEAKAEKAASGVPEEAKKKPAAAKKAADKAPTEKKAAGTTPAKKVVKKKQEKPDVEEA